MADVTVTSLAKGLGANGLNTDLVHIVVTKEVLVDGTVVIRLAGAVSKTDVGASSPSDHADRSMGFVMDTTTATALASAITSVNV